MFRLLFERSTDAIWLFDPRDQIFVDCNAAAVQLMGCPSREQLLRLRPDELSPARQPDGSSSAEAARAIADLVEKKGAHRFEWTARRFDGTEVPLEVISTVISAGDRPVHVVVSRDISERRAAEDQVRQLNASLERRVEERTAELSRSEERLRTLIKHAPEAIVVFDGATGRFVSCNGNAARLFGLSREELEQLHPAEVSPVVQPDGSLSIDAARDYIERAMTGEPIVFDWVHRRPDGSLVPCEVRLVRLPGDGPPLIRGSILDNTERKRREQVQQATFDILDSVHQSGDLPSLFERIHGIIQRLMPARNFYLALYDPATAEISFPYYIEDNERHELSPRPIGSGLTGYVLRTGRPLLVDAAMNARKRQVGDAVTFEGYDQITYVEVGRPAAIWLGVPLMLEGRAIGVMAVQDYHDEKAYGEAEKQILTYVARQTALAIDRKRSEQALRESEQKFRALFEASSQGVMLHDENQYLEVNPATARILGYERPEQLVGKNPAETSPPFQPGGIPTATLARQHINECLTRGTARFEWVASRADGSDVPVEVILTRVEMGGRQIIQAVINEITARKEAEAELLRALAREKELSQLKTDFVSMVSHEFRTPLGIIMSSAEILGDYFDRLEPDERGHHLSSIARHSRRMSEMMEEVLVLGRLDAGRMNFKPGPIEIAPFFQRLVDEVHAATENRCPIDLLLQSLPAQGQGDERLLRHIVLNVLTNAVKYSEPGQPVEFTLESHDQHLVARVQDHGIGIPIADQAWLFNAFHRGRNVGQRPGTGLGLVIVKRCAELHGGEIHLDSEPGRGTTVTLRLPLF